MLENNAPPETGEPAASNEALHNYRERMQRLLERQQAALEATKERALKMSVFYHQRYGDDPEYQARAYGPVNSSLHAIEVTRAKIEFSRPRDDDDMTYRLRVLDELGQAIAGATPKGMPLRFHGAPIYAVRDIFASGGLSSSVDRLGTESSYDVAGQVSVTTPDTLAITIDGYTGLVGDEFLLPAGGIFVLLPRSQEEADAGSSLLMNNVDFRAHPEQLVAVMTTPQNVPWFRDWAARANIDEHLVCEFFDFPDRLRGIGTRIDSGELSLQDLVPYPLPETA